jgi:hypothetical protein
MTTKANKSKMLLLQMKYCLRISSRAKVQKSSNPWAGSAHLKKSQKTMRIRRMTHF